MLGGHVRVARVARVHQSHLSPAVLTVIVVRSVPMKNTLTLAFDVQFWEYRRSNSE